VSINEIEQAVQQLAPDELAKFRDGFAHCDAERWDRQMERDVAAGKVDTLAEEALTDLREGRCKDL